MLHVSGGEGPRHDAGKVERGVPQDDGLVIPVEEGKADYRLIGPGDGDGHHENRDDPRRHLLELREPLTGGSEPGIELERAAKLRDRLVVLALPGQGQPEVVGVLRVAAIAGGRFAKGAARRRRDRRCRRESSRVNSSTTPAPDRADRFAKQARGVRRPSKIAVELAKLYAHERIARRHLRDALVGSNGQRAHRATPRPISPSRSTSRGSSGAAFCPRRTASSASCGLPSARCDIRQSEIGGRVGRELFDGALEVCRGLAPALQAGQRARGVIVRLEAVDLALEQIPRSARGWRHSGPRAG